MPFLCPAPCRIPHLPPGEQNTNPQLWKTHLRSGFLLMYKVCMPQNSLDCGVEGIKYLISHIPIKIQLSFGNRSETPLGQGY